MYVSIFENNQNQIDYKQNVSIRLNNLYFTGRNYDL